MTLTENISKSTFLHILQIIHDIKLKYQYNDLCTFTLEKYASLFFDNHLWSKIVFENKFERNGHVW